MNVVEDEHVKQQQRHTFATITGPTHVMFRNLKDHLLALLNNNDSTQYAIGCVAWLTDFDCLDRLAALRGASLIVQKETFNTRASSTSRFPSLLMAKYGAVRPFPFMACAQGKDAALLATVAPLNQWKTFERESPIRIAGERICKTQVAPIMHHKFLITVDANGRRTAVWTGSFNFSKRASVSYENAAIYTDGAVIEVYFQEYLRVLMESEAMRESLYKA